MMAVRFASGQGYCAWHPQSQASVTNVTIVDAFSRSVLLHKVTPLTFANTHCDPPDLTRPSCFSLQT